MLRAPGIQIVAETENIDQALRQTLYRHPLLIIGGCHSTDFEECAALLTRIKAQAPSVSLILLTPSERTGDLARAIKLGCSGYVHPRISAVELIRVVRAVAGGECILDPSLLKRLLEEISNQEAASRVRPRAALSATEQNVLRLISEGQTNRLIAAKIGVSVATVKDHVQRIIEKLGVSDRTQAAVKAVRLGFVR